MNNRCPECDARIELEGHTFGCQRDRAETAEHERDTANRANEALRARVAELEAAINDVAQIPPDHAAKLPHSSFMTLLKLAGLLRTPNSASDNRDGDLSYSHAVKRIATLERENARLKKHIEDDSYCLDHGIQQCIECEGRCESCGYDALDEDMVETENGERLCVDCHAVDLENQ